jgi:ABC-2 type transport system permease protein
MPDLAAGRRAAGAVPAGAVPRRPSVAAVVLAHARHAGVAFVRTPIAAFFTLAFPLAWLVSLVLVVGNPAIPTPQGEVRLAQYLTPVAAVFAAVMAAYVTPATAIVLARERGELKRLRGTPSPPLAFVAGQVAAAAAVALAGVAVMIGAGMVLYGVRPTPAELPAMALTLVVGIGCFAALAPAVAAVVSSSQAAQAATIGSVVVLGFVSDMFTSGESMPRWLDAVGWFFPMRHFVIALRGTFDPFDAGAGPAWGHLGVLAAWAVAGVLAAWRLSSWEPRHSAGRVRSRRRGAGHGRRSAAGLVAAQVAYADRTLWRDVAAWFFALAFPLLLLVLLGSIWRDTVFDGVPYPHALVPGVVAYGAAVTAFVNLPEATAVARDRGVLRRLRGTPLPMWAYLAGRLGSALWMALLTLGLVLGVAVPVFGLRVPPAGVPMLLVTLLVGTASLGALGLGLAAVLKDAKTFGVVALAVLLPLSFLSGLFPFGAAEPGFVRAVASVFPLQHLGDAIDEALRATGWFPVAWHHLVVLLGWGVLGALAATRFARDPGHR